MIYPEISSDEFQDLDVSEAIATPHTCSRQFANSTGRSIGIRFDGPSEVGAFGFESFFYQIELFHSNTTGEGARSHSEILVVIVSSNISITIFISKESSIKICIRIVVDKLLTILTVSLFCSNERYSVPVSIEAHKTTALSNMCSAPASTGV